MLDFVNCAVCGKNIFEGDRGIMVSVLPLTRRYLCGECFDAIVEIHDEHERNNPKKLAKLWCEKSTDGVISWRWEGDETLPIEVNNFIEATLANMWYRCPYKLVKSGQDIEKDVTYYKRDLKAEKEAAGE